MIGHSAFVIELNWTMICFHPRPPFRSSDFSVTCSFISSFGRVSIDIERQQFRDSLYFIWYLTSIAWKLMAVQGWNREKLDEFRASKCSIISLCTGITSLTSQKMSDSCSFKLLSSMIKGIENVRAWRWSNNEWLSFVDRFPFFFSSSVVFLRFSFFAFSHHADTRHTQHMKWTRFSLKYTKGCFVFFDDSDRMTHVFARILSARITNWLDLKVKKKK